MTPFVEEGKLRFVLSWPFAPRDLDIHSFFKISRFSKCEVYFGKRDCVGTNLDTDNYNGGSNGVETITINSLGNYVYTFAVHKYTDVSNGVAPGEQPVAGSPPSPPSGRNETINVPDIPLSESRAKVSIYAYGFKGAIYQLMVPSFRSNVALQSDETDRNKFTWWIGFCLNGNEGVNSLSVINKLSKDKPNYTLCEGIYTTPKKSFLELNSQVGLKLKNSNTSNKRQD
jgi:hypothetical protein